MKKRRRKWWLWEWYSLCNRHWPGIRAPDPTCPQCRMGSWVFLPANVVSKVVYRIAPNFWRWWVNRPNSRTRKKIEEMFPNLRSK